MRPWSEYEGVLDICQALLVCLIKDMLIARSGDRGDGHDLADGGEDRAVWCDRMGGDAADLGRLPGLSGLAGQHYRVGVRGVAALKRHFKRGAQVRCQSLVPVSGLFSIAVPFPVGRGQGRGGGRAGSLVPVKWLLRKGISERCQGSRDFVLMELGLRENKISSPVCCSAA
jgi:hypothetical protein